MNTFIAAHVNKAGMMCVGLLIAGFISDIKWNVLAHAVGL